MNHMICEWRICRIWGVPLGETIQRVVRAPIANWMNRYPDTCWADLVMWWVHPTLHPFWEIFEMRHTAGGCLTAGAGEPYCGKCRKADKCPTDHEGRPSYTFPIWSKDGPLWSIRHRLIGEDRGGKYRPHMAGRSKRRWR